MEKVSQLPCLYFTNVHQKYLLANFYQEDLNLNEFYFYCYVKAKLALKIFCIIENILQGKIPPCCFLRADILSGMLMSNKKYDKTPFKNTVTSHKSFHKEHSTTKDSR